MWTSPYTWAVGELVTAAKMNQHVSDELAWLGGTDGIGSAFPTTGLVDGQRYVIALSDRNRWQFVYDASEPGTYKWKFIGGPPMRGSAVTVPLAGDYYAIGRGSTTGGGTTTAATFTLELRKAGVAVDSTIADAASSGWGGGSRQRIDLTVNSDVTGCSASDVIDMNGADDEMDVAVWPVRCI